MNYNSKYLKYKTKYLELQKKIQNSDKYNNIIKEIFNHPKTLDVISNYNSDDLKELLIYIFDKNNITKLLDLGTTKFVFENSIDPSMIFKMSIINKMDIQIEMREPIYMLSSPFCNKPIDINIYGKVRKTCDSTDYTVNMIDMDNICIICWFEKRAEETNPKITEVLKKFIKDTEPIIKNDGFTDLGKQNIGKFNENIYKWIDVQPDGKKSLVMCIEIL